MRESRMRPRQVDMGSDCPVVKAGMALDDGVYAAARAFKHPDDLLPRAHLPRAPRPRMGVNRHEIRQSGRAVRRFKRCLQYICLREVATVHGPQTERRDLEV